MELLNEILLYLSHLLTLCGTINLALAAIRYVRSKIGTRPPPKSGDKSGTDCPNAGTKIINNIYNYNNNTYNEHYHSPCTHSGKAARRRRGRSGRRMSSRRR